MAMAATTVALVVFSSINFFLFSPCKWHLTGAVPFQFYDAEDYLVERLYIASYQDGSVRIWHATYPTLSLIHVLGAELADIVIAGASAPVSALEFCFSALSLAIGNGCGTVFALSVDKAKEVVSFKNAVLEAGASGSPSPSAVAGRCPGKTGGLHT